MRFVYVALLAAACSASPGQAQSPKGQEALLAALDAKTSGVLGACVGREAALACVNPDRPMPMQSVMKLLVAIAALDRVDQGGWQLDDSLTLYPRDRSVSVQPIAKLITESGYRTTIGDLIRRAVIDSDNAAADILIDRLGGVAKVQAVLDARKINGVRIDRDERHLQSESHGLGSWQPRFADPATFEAAIKAVPEHVRDAAWNRYRRDIRDTATPRGMAELLLRLHAGKLLSPKSTAFLIQTLSDTRTGPDRLMAGAPAGWRVAHKTGTSGAWRGMVAATNDVGLLYAPDGDPVVAVAFLADSTDPDPARADTIAEVARIAARDR